MSKSPKPLTEEVAAPPPQAPLAVAGTDTDAPDRRRWWVLIVIAIAQLMVVLDVTIVNIAMPSAQRDLGFSDGSRQWIVTAYALAFGSLLLLGGRLADLFGRKIVFLVGRTSTPAAVAQAQLHSYSAAYWWSAGLFTAGAVIAALVFHRGRPASGEPSGPIVHM
ncbi:MFS family permease [Streptomyces pseudovenezuelae]|uniref:MFS family permease n=1 Tax=Streptomyces pseudovenezuelae TaxID=67350 RepID=A0ABT6LPS2_9ACTN|nr:MFS transporter [Streptomyces pseudovenezuelae]MDH6218247.1 MFS family permease [Streptomyces pseudovenezuelae]